MCFHYLDGVIWVLGYFSLFASHFGEMCCLLSYQWWANINNVDM